MRTLKSFEEWKKANLGVAKHYFEGYIQDYAIRTKVRYNDNVAHISLMKGRSSNVAPLPGSEIKMLIIALAPEVEIRNQKALIVWKVSFFNLQE
jgi:hypothetical protein